MNELYLEDLHVGDRFGSDTIEVTEENIIAFAQEWDRPEMDAYDEL